MKRPVIPVLVVMLIGCSAPQQEKLGTIDLFDTRVDIYVVSDWEAADGRVDVSAIKSGQLVKRVFFARADDYPQDVKGKIVSVRGHDRRISITIRDGLPESYGSIYVSPAGTTVEIIGPK